MTMEQRYFSASQAASYLGYKGPSAIRNAIYRGQLRPDGARPGGAYLFRLETLDAFAARFLPPSVSPDERDGYEKGNKESVSGKIFGSDQSPRPTNRKGEGCTKEVGRLQRARGQQETRRIAGVGSDDSISKEEAARVLREVASK
jgi:hypothetical protein